jgi:hypothetical protein
LTVKISADGMIALEGVCPIEDAEPLQRHLLAYPANTLDWRSCSAAHTAVIQILLAARPRLLGPPAHPFLRMHVEPLLLPSSD